MADDAVRRTSSVPGLGGFAGKHPEQPPPPRHQDDPEEPVECPAHDEVLVRSDAGAALQLLRERVLASTRQRLATGRVSVPVFAEVVENESIEDFLSRLLSDQNQLAACATSGTRRDLTAAFEDGLAEARELLLSVPGEGSGAVNLVAVEFGRRLAALED